MLRRLVTNKKLLVIVPVVLALALAGLFLPARKVSIEPYGMLSLESKITLSVGYEAAYASPATPVYWTFSEAKASSATSIQISEPGGTVAGDLLVAGMTADGVTTLTPPAGWNDISQGSSGGKVTSGSWWKIASGEGANYTFQTDLPGGDIYIFILRITGAHATAPVDVSAFAPGESINPTCPTVTTNVVDTLVLRLFGADDEDILPDTGYPPGHTGIMVDTSGGGSKSCSGGAAWIEQATADVTGTASFTLTAPEEWYATTIAIKPPAPDISNTPASKDFGNVTTSTDYWSSDAPPDWPLDDGECFFQVTNNSGAAVNIAIRATDFVGGTKGWALGGTAGEDIVVLKAGASGTTANETAMVILAIKDTNYDFISSLAAGSSKKWELKMETPTSFSNTNTKTAIITLTATLD